MAKAKKAEVDLSTEEKIKEAARKVFTSKGYAAARTRDIAEEAGINLALLNYYFRSKEKLFEIVMLEKLSKFFGVISPILNDPSSNVENKISLVAAQYIDMLTETPDLPLFILSEIRANPHQFINRMPLGKTVLESVFMKQLQARRPDITPLHFLMNLLGLTVFPFVMSPLFLAVGVVTPKSFAGMMDMRKELIPRWMNAILKTK